MKDWALRVLNRGSQLKASSTIFTSPRMTCTRVALDTTVISVKTASGIHCANSRTDSELDYQLAVRSVQPNNVPNVALQADGALGQQLW